MNADGKRRVEERKGRKMSKAGKTYNTEDAPRYAKGVVEVFLDDTHSFDVCCRLGRWLSPDPRADGDRGTQRVGSVGASRCGGGSSSTVRVTASSVVTWTAGEATRQELVTWTADGGDSRR